MTGAPGETAAATSVPQPRHEESEPGPAPRFDFREVYQRVGSFLDKQIFFVGGAEKSGTSWLQRLLDLHPEVSCAGEAHFIESLLPTVKKALDDHNRFMLDHISNPFLDELGEKHPTFDASDLRYVAASSIAMLLVKQSRRKPVRAVGERTTKTVHDFGMLAKLFPDTKCIHIARDPRDCSVSRWFHTRRSVPPSDRDQMVTKDHFARQHAIYWTEVVGRGVRFGQGNPDRYIELRYEDLVDQTAPVLTRIFRFLGVDDRLETAERCTQEAAFEKLSGGRARGKEDIESFFRKGVVGDWKNHLSAETNVYIIEKAGPLMRHFGYL